MKNKPFLIYLLQIQILLFCFFSCAYKFPSPYRGAQPTSKQPHNRSICSGLSYNVPNSFEIFPYWGYPDSKVIGYELPHDTVVSEFFQNEMKGQVPYGYHHPQNLYPGAVWVGVNKLMDEAEVSNISWREFLFYIRRDSSESYYRQMIPDEAAQPVDGYATNPFYYFFPVVGIRYEQVIAYCRWRTEIANRSLESAKPFEGALPKQKIRVTYRLPTEKEWETYAACGLDMIKYPYGVKFSSTRMKIRPKAASYLQFLNNLPQSKKQIKKDIRSFNRNKQEHVFFYVKRNDVPYFLQSKSPFYIFNIPINNYGLYNIVGNVSEMVAEQGIAKGGSYLDALEACKLKNQFHYSKALPNLGFRTLCEVHPLD